MSRLVVIAGLLVALIACSEGGAGAGGGGQAGGGGGSADQASPAPGGKQGGKATAKVGQPFTVEEFDEPRLRVTVQKAQFSDKYEPRPRKGHTYVSFLVKYEALTDGANYCSCDWQAFANNAAIGPAFAVGAPDPALQIGDLPKGRTASGWLVFQAPRKSTVLLSFKTTVFDQTPTFEVPVRVP